MGARRTRRARLRFLAHLRDDEYDVLVHDEDDARRRLEDATDDLLAATFAALVEETRREDAEDPVAAEEDYRHAREALAQASLALSEEEREILALVYREGKWFGEAGEALGVSESTARRRHEGALRKLRKELGKLGVDRAPPPRDPASGKES